MNAHVSLRGTLTFYPIQDICFVFFEDSGDQELKVVLYGWCTTDGCASIVIAAYMAVTVGTTLPSKEFCLHAFSGRPQVSWAAKVKLPILNLHHFGSTGVIYCKCWSVGVRDKPPINSKDDELNELPNPRTSIASAVYIHVVSTRTAIDDVHGGS